MLVGRGRVLIVDDEHLLRTLMKDVLCRGGCQTVAVENGDEALRVLQKDRDFVLILSDVHMPRMDGLELLQIVRRDYPTIPVLMTSVHSTSDQIQSLIQEGATAYLPRPF